MKDDVRSFIARERQRLVSYVRGLGVPGLDPEDVVQDVALRMLERSDPPAPDALAAYIFRSLKNRVIDRTRTTRPTVSVEQDDRALTEVLRDHRGDPLEVLQSEAGKEELFRALDSLSDTERAVVIAHELEGVPFRELTERMGIPQNTLLSHKSRGMKKLRAWFAAQTGDST